MEKTLISLPADFLAEIDEAAALDKALLKAGLGRRPSEIVEMIAQG